MKKPKTKPHFVVSFSVNLEDLTRIRKLQARGVKNIETLRLGIAEMEKQSK